MVSIVTRAAWGARASAYTARTLDPAGIKYFSVHWDGPSPVRLTGPANMRRIEAEHLANGWAGVGYSFVVDTAGACFEARGWDRKQAASPKHNTDTVSVQCSIGQGQKPTPAQLATIRGLYDDACRRYGRTLAMRWHGYDHPTACPGPDLIAWVKAGMPAPISAKPTKPTKPTAPAPAPAFTPVRPGGAITLAELRPGQSGWSVERYKRVALSAHGPAYRAAFLGRWGAAATSATWDGAAAQVTRDHYLWLARNDASWGKGDLSTPGPSLLKHLGFDQIK